MHKRLLIVHHSDVSPVIREALDTDAFELRFMSGFEGVTNTVLELKPALVLFDISHWGKPFEKLFQELMNFGGTRSIRKVILAQNGGMDEKVSALETGADDFLVKPVSSRELMARLKSVLRSHQEEDVQTVGDLSLYRDSMEISLGAERKKLGPREFDLLRHLMDHSGRVFSREELLESVWVPWEVDDHRAVDVCVSRLREKIESDPSHPRWLLTRRGQGYVFVNPEDPNRVM